VLVTLLATLALGATAAAGCGSSNGGTGGAAGKPGSDKKITFVTPLIGHPVWLQAKKGFDEAAHKFGFKGKWVGPGNISVETMVAEIDRAVTQRADAIITMALNASAMGPSIQKAKAAGIPVVLVNADGAATGRDAFLGSSAEAMGQAAAQGIGKALHGTGDIAILTGALDAENLNAQIKAFKATLAADYPGVKVVDTQADNSDLQQASEKAGELLRKHPDLNGVYNPEANGAIAFCELLRKSPRKRFVVIGTDDLAQTLDCVRKGLVYGTVPQNFAGMGYYGSEAALALLEKKRVPSTVDLGTTLITKGNLGNYKHALDQEGARAASSFALKGA
jgi:ABC-type sugar transport system substrate-binding protein